jgi:hypothetical protein
MANYNQWVVGRTEPIIARWFLNSSEVVSGSATVVIKTDIAGTFKYVQSDGTLTLTPTSLSMTYTAPHGWLRELIPTLEMLGPNGQGLTFIVEATHSDALLPLLTENNILSNENRPGGTVR